MTLTAVTTKRRLGEEHSPLRAQVVTELRQAILSRRLKPGERLIEGRLADELGVSRNPVRADIRVLESEGLVEVATGGGTGHKKTTPKRRAGRCESRERGRSGQTVTPCCPISTSSSTRSWRLPAA